MRLRNRHRTSTALLASALLVAIGLSTWSPVRCRVDVAMAECCCCAPAPTGPSVGSECCTGADSPRSARSARLTNGESQTDTPRLAPPVLAAVASIEAPALADAVASWSVAPVRPVGIGPPILRQTLALLI